MKKYQVHLWDFGTDVDSIRIVDVERETDKCAWVCGGRESKRSSSINYCDTWEEAHELLIISAKNHVIKARQNLDSRMAELEELLQKKRQ